MKHCVSHEDGLGQRFETRLRPRARLGANHNETIGCRSADLFHIAAAVQLGCEQFLTFDIKQTALAKAVGLAVKP